MPTDVDVSKITVALPSRSYDELKQKARKSNMSITEFVRRAIALYGLVIENDHTEVVLRDTVSRQETLVRIA